VQPRQWKQEQQRDSNYCKTLSDRRIHVPTPLPY
jgi:hypothetical protein